MAHPYFHTTQEFYAHTSLFYVSTKKPGMKSENGELERILRVQETQRQRILMVEDEVARLAKEENLARQHADMHTLPPLLPYGILLILTSEVVRQEKLQREVLDSVYAYTSEKNNASDAIRGKEVVPTSIAGLDAVCAGGDMELLESLRAPPQRKVEMPLPLQKSAKPNKSKRHGKRLAVHGM